MLLALKGPWQPSSLLSRFDTRTLRLLSPVSVTEPHCSGSLTWVTSSCFKHPLEMICSYARSFPRSSALWKFCASCVWRASTFHASSLFFNICSPPPPFLELFPSTDTLWETLLHSSLLSELNYWFTPYLKWFVPRPWSCVVDFSWHVTIKTSYYIMNLNFHSRFLASVGFTVLVFLRCTVCCRGAWSALDCGVGVGNTWS